MQNANMFNNPLVLGRLASDPSGGQPGAIYFNTTDNTFHVYLTSSWVSLTTGGSAVTSISIDSANGFAGTSSGGTTPTLSITTTVTGILYGNGTSVAAAVAVNFPTLNQNTTGTAANVTATSNSTITTLSVLSLPTSQLSGQVTLAQLPTIATDTILGNNTGGSATPTALTVAQVNAILPVFTSSLNGLVPASGGGTSNYLRADGTWDAPPGGANTALSNLASTAINVSLIPANPNAISLGSATDYWASAFISVLNDNANVLAIDVFDRVLYDTSGAESIDFSNRSLQDASNNPQIEWSGSSGVQLPQLTANKALVLGGSGGQYITASATTATQIGYLSGASGTTGTGNLVLSASPTFTGTVTMAALSATTGSFSGAVNMNSNQINNLATPSLSTDAATKAYVDAAIAGLTWQGPAKAYSSTNVPLTGGATLTIDGYSVQNGDLIILGAQTVATTSGEYTVSGIGTSYLLTSNGLPSAIGDAWLITNGAIYANSAFVANYVFGSASTPMFTEFAGPTAYVFNAPLSISGNTVSITQANTSTNGYLSSTDWNTFNNKLTSSLSSTDIFVGNGSNVATAVSLSGDATLSNTGALTLATVNSNVGTFASVTVNAKGLVTAAAALSGDATTSGSVLTLATVNSNVGSFAIATITVNAKGLVTAASAATTTGSGSVVLATSPTLVTPNIGAATGTSLQLSGLTASQAVFTDGSKNLVSNAITGTGNVVMSASPTLTGTIVAAAANFSGAIGANGGITSTGALTVNANSAGSAINLYSSMVTRGASGAAITETYTDSTTLIDNTTTNLPTFTSSTVAGQQIDYVIENGASPSLTRTGIIQVTCSSDGSNPSLIDSFSESGDCGIVWSAANSSGTITITATATSQGSNRTMRYDLKSFRR